MELPSHYQHLKTLPGAELDAHLRGLQRHELLLLLEHACKELEGFVNSMSEQLHELMDARLDSDEESASETARVLQRFRVQRK